MFEGGPKWGVAGAWVGEPVGGPARGLLPRKAPQLARASSARARHTHRRPATSPRGARIAPECARACTTPSLCRIRRTGVLLLSPSPPGMW